MRPVLRTALALSLLGLLAGIGVAMLREPPRPDRLREVVEPITIVDAISWDDGGSHGLAFRDARGVTRYVCLMDDLENHQNLVVGSYSPISDEQQLRQHPIGGREERAFRQLLERWRRADPDARWWDRRLELYEKGEVKPDELSRGAPSGDGAGLDIKGSAVYVLRKLRGRHPA